MAIEDAVCLATLLGGGDDLDQVVRSYEARRRPRVDSIRAAVRERAAAAGMGGSVMSELLEPRRADLPDSLKVYEDLIEDPFAAAN
jgi:2-polyprenyl-6-methoxyphenol hydroxylase-like FAD-dependent oxidoreductase